MGMNNYGAKRVIVDIETVSLAEAGEYLDPIEPLAPPDLSLITPAKNLVDPAKVAADIEKRRSAAIEEHRLRCEQQVQKRAEALERCALDLDLCRIVAIGWMFEDDREPHVLPAHSDEMEGDLLRAFWAALDDRVTVGYNQVGFDLPILLRRSLYLGVSAPMLNLDRYRSNHIDLQMRLSLNGTKPFRKLDWYCKRFGLDVPKDEHGGKDIGALVAADDWDGVTAHCRADVLKTAALARRMGLLRPQHGYGNTVYRCACGFEAWGAAVTCHEHANPDHAAMVAVGYHRFDPRTNDWEFRPMVNRSQPETGAQ